MGVAVSDAPEEDPGFVLDVSILLAAASVWVWVVVHEVGVMVERGLVVTEPAAELVSLVVLVVAVVMVVEGWGESFGVGDVREF